ncbi:MAG: NAD(P)H-dependent oxidoreductase [Bacteroidota bacterium]
MKSVLILFAHPRFEQSRTNKVLVQGIKSNSEVTFHDLYETYPDFHIDIPYEKKLLEQHDVIIWHHPFYWYSCPPLMKQWIDLVLEYGWAYGPNGNALNGKKCLQIITTGGSAKVYCAKGKNVYSINEFLRPFEQTARLCGMEYLAPFAIMGTHQLTRDDLQKYALQYQQIIGNLQQDKPIEALKNCIFQNDLPQLRNENINSI